MNIENDATHEIAKALTGEIMDHVYAGIIITDENGEILVFNQASEQIFGFSRNEAIGRNISLFVRENKSPQCDSKLKNFVMQGASPKGCQLNNANGVNRDGVHIPLHLTTGRMSFNNYIYFISSPNIIMPTQQLH